MMHSVIISSPVGALALEVSEDENLRGIELLPRGREMDLEASSEFRCRLSGGTASREWIVDAYAGNFPINSPIVDVIYQLGRYFQDPGWRFRFPLALEGTPFQRRVWRALQSIPSGQTISYGMLAARIGSCARAVGSACRKNPIPIVIPCHRVVGARGPGGFMGSRTGEPLAIKKWLLAHEFLRGRKNGDNTS